MKRVRTRSTVLSEECFVVMITPIRALSTSVADCAMILSGTSVRDVLRELLAMCCREFKLMSYVSMWVCVCTKIPNRVHLANALFIYTRDWVRIFGEPVISALGSLHFPLGFNPMKNQKVPGNARNCKITVNQKQDTGGLSNMLTKTRLSRAHMAVKDPRFTAMIISLLSMLFVLHV